MAGCGPCGASSLCLAGLLAYATLVLPVPGRLVRHIHCASHIIPSCRLAGSPRPVCQPVSAFPKGSAVGHPRPVALPPPLAQMSSPCG